ncbi:MAG: cohesin domain-containing protein [Clostridium sp.]|nr:cohesin domain-containing protein [Clostridium sp.]MDU7084370.1 cohesin domain-containing protein [Clostridium sp.]
MDIFKSRKLRNFSKIACLVALFLFLGINTHMVMANNSTKITYSVFGTPRIGNTIEIAVNATNVSNLYAESFDFVYDPSLIEIQSIENGTIFENSSFQTPVKKFSNGQASIVLTLNSKESPVSNSGTLAVIKAKVLKEGSFSLKTTNGNSALSINGLSCRVKLSNKLGKPISYSADERWVPLNTNHPYISSITVDKPSPQPANTPIQITANGSGNGTSSYKFWIQDGTQWQVIQDYSSINTCSWTPTKTGSYRLWVDIKDANGVTNFNEIPFDVAIPPLLLKSINIDKPSPQISGTPIRISADASGHGDLAFKFWVHDGFAWTVVQDFSSKDYFDWTPSREGSYRLWVDVKDSTGKMLSKEIYYDIKSPLVISSIDTNKPSPQKTNTTIRIDAKASSNTSLSYKFWILEGNAWKVVQDFSSKNYYDWTPTKPGNYRIWVDVKDGSGKVIYKEINYSITTEHLNITSIDTNKPSPQPANSTIRISPKATGAGNLSYKFWVLKEGTGVWNVVQDFSSKNYYDWKPTESGTYRLFIDVKDSYGNITSKWIYFDVSHGITINDINTDKPSPQIANSTIRITPSVSGGSGENIYKFWILKEGTGVWNVSQDFSSKNYYDWKPTEPGTYRLFIDAKDSTGTMVSKWVYFNVSDKPLEILSIDTDKLSPQPANSTIRILPKVGGSGNLSYKFWILKEGTGVWNVVQDFSSKNYYDWKPREAGTYRLFIDVKDSTGKMVSKWVYFDVSQGLTINNVKTDKPSPQTINSTIRISPDFSGGTGVHTYKFWILKEGTGKWDVVQDFSSKNYFDWKPSASGTYRLWVDVKDNTGNMISKWVYYDIS